jgi:hypothetical protein
LHDLQQSHQKGVFGLKKGILRKIFLFWAKKKGGGGSFFGEEWLDALSIPRRSFFLLESMVEISFKVTFL